MAGRTNKSKKCRRCGLRKAVDQFVDISGAPNPRGGFCSDCHALREQEWKEEAKKEKEAKLRKLRIIYGDWWRHYCLPQEFADDIYSERPSCPYCGGNLPAMYLGNDPSLAKVPRAHLDHMDPLELGGEDSIRNVVYVCDACNLKKGARSFVSWLDHLPVEQVKNSREIYVAKHGHAPEDFEPGEPIERTDGTSALLLLDEKDLREMYAEPMVDGPPITLTVEIDEDGYVTLPSDCE